MTELVLYGPVALITATMSTDNVFAVLTLRDRIVDQLNRPVWVICTPGKGTHLEVAMLASEVTRLRPIIDRFILELS